MILDKFVLIKPSQKTIHYYEKLGYKIPKFLNCRNKINYKRDHKFKVKVTDLHYGSKIKVSCQCNDCGKIRVACFRDYKALCHSCKRAKLVGEKAPGWKGGKQGLLNRLPKCKKCSKILSANKYEFCKSCSQLGNRNPAWNDTLSISERLKNSKGRQGEIGIWKKRIKKYFNNACIICSSKNRIECHHLNSFNKFPDQRYDIKNGVTICFLCHKKFHKKYGRGNNTKDQFLIFLKESEAKCNTLL